MTIVVQTRWKLLVELKEDALHSLPTLFNANTGRTFIRTLGSRTNFDFSPTTLSCTSRFHDLLKGTYRKLGFSERKFPFRCIDSQAFYNFEFRQYGKSLLVVEVERQTVLTEPNRDLLAFSSIWDCGKLSELVLNMLGLISNATRSFKPATDRPKVYCCNRIIGTPQELPKNDKLVELLTRHRSPSSMVLESVIKKNEPLQSDISTLLVDRQGVVASIPSDLAQDRTVIRRFEAASNMLEIISCVKRLLEKSEFLTFENSEIIDLSFYFGKPERRFAHSTSSMAIWNRLASEFGLTTQDWLKLESELGLKKILDRDERKILVITALPIEAAPIVAKLSSVAAENTGELFINHGKFRSGENTADVYVASVGVGNTKAALNTANLLELYRPDLTVFSGIAGGLKEASIGSVVIANLVYYYESGKEAKKGFMPRPRTIDLSRKAHSLVSTFMANIRNGDKNFEVYFKPIACGEKVLGNTKGSSATLISSAYGDALAVEMEGFGFLAAFDGTHHVGILVRGISDRLDNKSHQENQPLAIENATNITFDLMNFYLSSAHVPQHSY